jgi:cytoskeletal protein CcmA (bactofilin family)
MANILTSIRKPGAPLTSEPSPTSAPITVAPAQDRSRESGLPYSSANKPSSESSAAGSQTATRTLVVGREIVLSGEISACDRLVVEGTVKANIKDCKDIAIAEGGLFTGAASVESAEIRGRFEGELIVSGRLLIRAPGQVSASVKYREIEIERGGRLSGNVDATDGAKPKGSFG